MSTIGFCGCFKQCLKNNRKFLAACCPDTAHSEPCPSYTGRACRLKHLDHIMSHWTVCQKTLEARSASLGVSRVFKSIPER